MKDVPQLTQLEERTFDSDRLSQRRFKHWVKAENRIFMVVQQGESLVGYGLVLLNRGTRLARLYSIAVDQATKGQGVGRQLLNALEHQAVNAKRLYMRLEVASNNQPAIHLYESNGYILFGCKHDYYENHQDALRMQKRIRYLAENHIQRETIWYKQTTEFTCGPAALLMALSSLKPKLELTQELELDIWREATTIFMTSGHGGCHPIGLALSAQQLGAHPEVFINQSGPLFVNGVRSTAKKEVIAVVDRQFHEKAQVKGVNINHQEVTQEQIANWLSQGCAIIILISTYRIDGKKAPHWVTISGIDDQCIYVHDPDPPSEKYSSIDCQYIPIAREDFEKMSAFGSEKLRTCVVIR
ncbi:pectic acid lyase [Oleiphilus messinensis]|uniref:Pectic acid lyase n=1 Tax=Oleiphilus messinensis TaxID=141451 RepID=A0A1Y0IF00_9GAMM|nr:GNAT family N-acetyltransferase/peptidase C39 family protein [Oleiphilus messinensis]ARU57953.1 pectic acid lyase [Oleiphilus messinensis]